MRIIDGIQTKVSVSETKCFVSFVKIVKLNFFTFITSPNGAWEPEVINEMKCNYSSSVVNISKKIRSIESMVHIEIYIIYGLSQDSNEFRKSRQITRE